MPRATTKRITSSLQGLFYRYHADRLDTNHHAAIIIPTVLGDETVDDWNWLFQVYGRAAIQTWMAAPGHAATLPPLRERLWTLILVGIPRKTPRWVGGNARRIVPQDALPAWFPDDLRERPPSPVG